MGYQCYKIEILDEDSPWSNDALDLFEAVNIRPSSVEEPYAVAIYRGAVIAAATLGWSNSEDGTFYVFSVVVAEGWRRKGIGSELVDTVIDEVKARNEAHPGATIRAWVVSPHMAALLEDKGFEAEHPGWSLDRPHMELQP